MSHLDLPIPLADAKSARLIFLGTKDFALPAFEYLCDHGWQILGLITQPDRPQGRKQLLIPSKIKVAAESRGIPVYQPEDLNSSEGIALVSAMKPHLLVTVAYGQILKPHILEIPPFGGVNLHGSLLPKYRGAAPVARAMEQGEIETGVTVIQMSPQVDAGGMLANADTPIGADETAGTLEARLALIGAPLLANSIKGYLEGSISPSHQDKSLATRAPKLSKEKSFIDWSAPAFKVDRFIRAMNPWPLARSHFLGQDSTKPLSVVIHHSNLSTDTTTHNETPGDVISIAKDSFEVSCGDGRCISVKLIQTDGRNVLSAGDWIRGVRLQAGDRFLSHGVEI